MSQTSRSAPGERQGRNKGKGTNRFKSAIQTKRIDEGRRAAIHEVGDERRARVYRTDVEFAPSDTPTPLPVRGSVERIELLTDVVRLRQDGLSYMRISHALYPKWPMWSYTTIANLIKEAKRRNMFTETGGEEK